MKIQKAIFIAALTLLLIRQAAVAYEHGTCGAPVDFTSHEMIFIHTDRDFYIAGERLYFRLDLVSTDGRSASSIAYLIIRNRSNVIIGKLSVPVDRNSGNGSVYLPDTLSSSAYQLVAFTNHMRNFDHDNYGQKQIIVVNRFDQDPLLSGVSDRNRQGFYLSAGNERGNGDMQLYGESGLPSSGSLAGSGIFNYTPSVTITPCKQIYTTREKAEIEISASGNDLSEFSVSVAVIQQETLLREPGPGITTVRPRHKGTRKSDAGIIYPVETVGPVITGRVTDRTDRTPIAGATVFLNTPDSAVNLLYAQTLPNGVFHFRLNDYHAGKQLFFSVYENDIAETAEIEILDKYRVDFPFTPILTHTYEISSEFITTSQDIVRVNKTLGLDFNSYVMKQTGGYRPEVYARPSYSFSIFSDYVLLNDLQEIARELLPWLRIRLQDGIYNASLFLELYNTFTRETPVFFLDGIFTDDINRIIHLRSEDIAKIELQNYPWRYGRVTFPGIIALYTREQEYRNLLLAEPSVKIDNQPASPASVYEPPDYDPHDPGFKRPDFRQLLFWDPAVSLAGTGDKKVIGFFTGDIKGDFIIRVRGMTPEGEIISEEKLITIK